MPGLHRWSSYDRCVVDQLGPQASQMPETEYTVFVQMMVFVSVKIELRLYSCQGYVPLTLDVMRVAFKVPLAFHTPL